MEKVRILAVNDLIIALTLLEVRVIKNGLPIELDMAMDGDIAVEKIEKGEQYDAILMNLEMPSMNGWQATKKIRELGVTTPIIAWSVHVESMVIRECLEAGMNEYVEIDIFTMLDDILAALYRVGVKVGEKGRL